MIGWRLRGAVVVTVAAFVAGGCASHAADSTPPASRPSGWSASQPSSSVTSGSPQQAVPESLRAACGRPGAQATVAMVPITIPRQQCDLTGVVVHYGQTGVTVPAEGAVQANAR